MLPRDFAPPYRYTMLYAMASVHGRQTCRLNSDKSELICKFNHSSKLIQCTEATLCFPYFTENTPFSGHAFLNMVFLTATCIVLHCIVKEDFADQSVRWSVGVSVRPFVRPSVLSSVLLTGCLPVCLSLCLSLRGLSLILATISISHFFSPHFNQAVKSFLWKMAPEASIDAFTC